MVRTTSRSEGENSFFGRYFSPTATLVEFFSHFDSAIDVQRHIHLKLNADLSIKACGDIITYDIKEDDVRLFTVHYNRTDNSATCSCSKFQRVGMLCRHIFMVYKDARIDNIPVAYIVARWTRGVCLPQVFGVNGQTVDLTAPKDGSKTLINQLWTEIHAWVSLAKTDTVRVR
ncbi:protein FAR1-RELATED SEQUENCE 5-like [Ipomoea triloba]|uniref:protein FAR1-RELATED SEQUENCE 5-like n=1 Tax=Ipomoea triloba TaxID=35885 RepID=UPI00125D66CA|nr:protein FAR1-RELATED SEQUENCE 5-like [Ipomoea triloba]